VFFLIAFAVGYVAYDLMGYQAENADAPTWVKLVAGGAVFVVAVIPCVAAVFFGRRAANRGDRRGIFPLVIGVIAGIGLLVLSFLP
jgi:hypothetical protein